jgi:Ca2+-binding EF-hand superfamily protein
MIGSIGSVTSLFAQTNFSAVHQQREAKMFQEMDADGSGSISKDEFTSWDKKMREKMSGMGNAGGMPSADDIFTQLDSDGDGSISKDEFSAMAQKGPPSGPPPGGGAGGAGGAGGSGSTLQTLLDALSQNSDSSKSTSSGNSLDTNGDGKVSLQEFIAGLKSSANSLNSLSQYLQTSTASSLDVTA